MRELVHKYMVSHSSQLSFTKNLGWQLMSRTICFLSCRWYHRSTSSVQALKSTINVYKPPSAEFQEGVFTKFDAPTIVIGDFNSHSTMWGYSDNVSEGEKLVNWMTREDFSLLYSATDPKTFRSARWIRSYNPDLCFLSKDSDGSNIPATR